MSIEQLYDLGDDALQNLFEMTIAPTQYLSELAPTLLRVQNLTIPASGANKYEVHYKTVMIEKIGGKPDSPKEFTFDIRIDRNYLVYKGLVAWKNAVSNTKTGVMMPDTGGLRVPITVYPVTPEGDKITGFGEWLFEGCCPTNISDIGYDYSSGDPITVTVTMSFLAMNDNNL